MRGEANATRGRHGRGPIARRALVLVALLSAVVGSAGPASAHPAPCAPTCAADVGGVAVVDDTGTVHVTVEYRAFGGAPPGPGVTPAGPVATPAAGVAVRAVPDGGGPPAATATTDATGHATLLLAPGAYWVYVPPTADPDSGVQAGVIARDLPDGTLVANWQAVEVPAGGEITVAILLTMPLP